jgi:hypothetical protein
MIVTGNNGVSERIEQKGLPPMEEQALFITCEGCRKTSEKW